MPNFDKILRQAIIKVFQLKKHAKDLSDITQYKTSETIIKPK